MDVKYLVGLVAVLFVSVGVKAWALKKRRINMGQISQAEFQQRVQAGWQVVDVRTEPEYLAGALPGAKFIDFYLPDFQARVAELDKNGKYLLYCRTGIRSSKARKLMQDLGFEHVADLAGGYGGIVNRK
jgi:rhodanese-related sulfurtransferase